MIDHTTVYRFVTSPELVTAMVFSGDMRFNPLTDSIKLDNGKEFRFSAPSGDDLPSRGYDAGQDTYQAPMNSSTVKV